MIINFRLTALLRLSSFLCKSKSMRPYFLFNASSIPYLKKPTRLHFSEDVLKEKKTIFDGVGTPDLQLALYLLLTWTIIALILIRGVKSSGKAAYFLGILDELIMSTILHPSFFSSFSVPHHDDTVFPIGHPSRSWQWYSVFVQTRMESTL